ncbi:hypothetical protein A1O3_09829 [Capronia epimyces CBS 606.96]|uniref:Aminotransferase class I/classII large domain-containing protein n=1 Tax=Capronia epimyces CBS 606.96 TaxID=1182542 RepID=W9XAT5_9EURO|nr:uncharacterized protein A1O3_09829 [Capronia epimyces CBS 606.96]EXJ77602.1 hypothetical protein A1O3_09829 [Capronia epimyces CBS 606.96]
MAPQTATSPSLPQPHIDLQKGWPTPRLLPSQALLAAAEATLSGPARATEALLYGPNIGDPALRRECAEWLSRLYCLRSPPSPPPPAGSASQNGAPAPVPISPDRICITAGASGNLACIMAAFTDPVYTRRVWMVEPTYFLACTVFDDAGFQGRLVGVPEDEDGLDVELLRRRIEAVDREEAASEPMYKRPDRYPKLYRHVIYMVPTFSNPSAKTYTLERREALVRLAREVDALLITDDCYDFLSWTMSSKEQGKGPETSPCNGTSPLHQRNAQAPPPPPRLVDVDQSLPGGDQEWGNAVSNGSFSKVMGPGLRCGWAEATPKFIWRLNQVGATLSGGAPGQFSSTLIEHVLRTGALEAHVQNVLIPLYQTRSATIRRAIEEHLGPLGVEIHIGRPYHVKMDAGHDEEVIGGFFLYILFPQGILADEVAAVALKEQNIRFLAAGMMAVRGSKSSSDLLKRGARLCWAWEEEDRLVEGVQRIAQVLKEKFLTTNGYH